MGDEENRMPKNARREKNSKKESEREREKKKEKQKEKERERAARERTAIQYGETRRTVALYQKVPATYIYIYIIHCVDFPRTSSIDCSLGADLLTCSGWKTPQ